MSYQAYYYHFKNHVRLKRKLKSSIPCDYCSGKKVKILSRKGYYGDTEGHKRVGQLGGTRTSKLYGLHHFVTIGQKGGKISPGNFKFDPERAREAGRKGGLARVLQVARSREKEVKGDRGHTKFKSG